MVQSSLLSRQLDKAMQTHGIKNLAEIGNYSDTSNLYIRLMRNENYLTKLGYQELPQQLYDKLIQEQKNKTNSPDAKTKKNLFNTQQ